MTKKENKISNLGRVAWIYTKYQLLTKTLLLLIVFPVSSAIIKMLLESTGRTNISSGDYLGFLLSFQGVGFLAITVILLAVLIAVDINAFVIMSALARQNKTKLSAKQLLMIGLKSLKKFLSPAGILIMVYMAVVIPLVGIGFTISPTKDFQIPNFITDVIFKNPLYSSLYFIVILILTIITLRYIFFFHYSLLENLPIGESLKKSAQLMKKHWKRFIFDFIIMGAIMGALAVLTIVLSTLLLIFLVHYFSNALSDSRAWSIFGLLTLVEITSFFTFMSVPMLCDILTKLFFKYNEKDPSCVTISDDFKNFDLGEDAYGKIRLSTKFKVVILIFVVLLFNVGVSVFLNHFFDDIFKNHREIEIVAHRGGGDLAAENTVESLEAVIKEGVQWSEIDVQRTKDGKYIINHDSDFKRVAGESRKSNEMTLHEIKQLQVKDLFDTNRQSQPVATIEEFLDAAKGRIGLFIELKGSTADEQMADEVIQMVKERDMESEIAILSLDYPLIVYVEEKYPEIQTGFLYFFAIGETAKLKGDILIMEEREATPDKIDEIHAAGKKAIVWTVNTEESIDKFVNSNVDGIITDYVLRLKDGIERRNNRTDLEIIIDNLFD